MKNKYFIILLILSIGLFITKKQLDYSDKEINDNYNLIKEKEKKEEKKIKTNYDIILETLNGLQENPNDMLLGEVVRQYIRELENFGCCIGLILINKISLLMLLNVVC